jgi:hypothetical protein
MAVLPGPHAANWSRMYQMEQWKPPTNENYMFRRWPVSSKSFDWKERRLQALQRTRSGRRLKRRQLATSSGLQNRAVVNARDEAEKVVAGRDPESIDTCFADQSATDTSLKRLPNTWSTGKSFLIKRNRADLAALTNYQGYGTRPRIHPYQRTREGSRCACQEPRYR